MQTQTHINSLGMLSGFFGHSATVFLLNAKHVFKMKILIYLCQVYRKIIRISLLTHFECRYKCFNNATSNLLKLSNCYCWKFAVKFKCTNL